MLSPSRTNDVLIKYTSYVFQWNVDSKMPTYYFITKAIDIIRDYEIQLGRAGRKYFLKHGMFINIYIY